MRGERLCPLAGLCRGVRIAPQAIPAKRGYAGEARIGGCAHGGGEEQGEVDMICGALSPWQSAPQKVIAKSAVPCYDKGQKHLRMRGDDIPCPKRKEY